MAEMDKMNGASFSMDGLNDLIASLEKKAEQQISNDDKMKKFNEIINGVASKYASKWIGYEDLVQELWVRIMELIKDCGGIEYTDEALVARIAWNKAVDLYRYHRRRYDSKAEFIEGSEQEYDNDTSKDDYFDRLHTNKFKKGYDVVMFKEVIDHFEKGSKKRKYVVLKLLNAGLLDFSDLDPFDKLVAAIPETEDEEGYIHLLGYKSHCPGSWTCQKRELYTEIKAFLGLLG